MSHLEGSSYLFIFHARKNVEEFCLFKGILQNML
uniref:Uncharacterized protein n=1 Tax=Anguilla anguilla TaxID=7936 RepID=A0A0E9QGE5_ANGAN